MYYEIRDINDIVHRNTYSLEWLCFWIDYSNLVNVKIVEGNTNKTLFIGDRQLAINHFEKIKFLKRRIADHENN